MPKNEAIRPEQKKNSDLAVILGGLAGNVMEWYDFAVYGYFAAVLAPLFFPSNDHASSLVAAFGAFAAGFLMRPLGGIIFGHIGDRVGRKAALSLSVMLMAVPSVLIGLLPTYAVIGWWAPAAMVVLRMVQGLSVGGEYTSSIVFLVENSHRKKRGYMGCWASVGSVAGALLGSGVGALINSLLTTEQVTTWGWRVPFLLGLGVAGTAVWLRRSLPEVELPEPEEGEAAPVVLAVRSKLGMILRTVGILMVYAVGYYVCFLYLTSFLVDRVKVPAYEALDINTIAMAAMMLLIPVMGKLSDKVGRKPVLVCAASGVVLLSYPLILFMHTDHWLPLLCSQLVFAVLMAAYAAANPAAMVESFPAKVRISAMSISFNISFAIFGGTMPMVAAWLLERTHDDYSIAWLLVAAGAVTLGSLLGHPETAGKRFSRLFPDDPEPALQTTD